MRADPAVFYTWPYSFENDICSEHSFVEVVLCLFPGQEMRTKAERMIREALTASNSRLKTACVLDQIATIYGVKGIGSKDYARFYVDASFGALPELSVARLEEFIVDLKDRLRDVRPIRDTRADWDARRRLNGKMYLDIFYRLFVVFTGAVDRGVKIARANVTRMLIAMTMRNPELCLGEKANKYYADCFARL
jgi:hypothetical protein